MKSLLFLSFIFLIILNEDKKAPTYLKRDKDNYTAENTISTSDYVTLA